MFKKIVVVNKMFYIKSILRNMSNFVIKEN